MYGSFDSLKLAGIAATAPTCVIHNKDLVDRIDEKVIRRQIKATGIERKHYVKDGQSAVDLSVNAANRLLNELGWDRKDIKVLLYVSSYTLFSIPSTAFYIQRKLGLESDCTCFDINLACSGFTVGIGTLGSLLQHCNEGDKALLIVGVTPSVAEESEMKDAFPLFGDSGAVAAFECKRGFKTYFSQNSEGKKLEALYKVRADKPIHMDGMGVFNFTITEVADSINEFFEHFNLDKNKVDYYFLHQAQKFILDKLIDFCEIEESKVPTSYKEFGNTGAVSIPLTICYNSHEIDMKARKTVFMSGFGAGLSWSNVWMETEDVLILPVEYSDEKLEKEDFLKEEDERC